jgi:GT2 family glycosyltransferase
MDLSVVIVNWNGRDYIAACLDSLAEAGGDLQTETIVVDNDSADQSVAFIRETYPQVTLIENEDNVGFGRGAQTGVERARGEFIAVVNPDVSLPPESLRRLVAVLREHPGAAWAGPRAVLGDGRTRSGPYKLGTVFEPLRGFPGVYRLLAQLGRNNHDRLRRCEKLDGACMVFRASMLREAGGVPTTTFMYGEEQILGARFRRLGYEAWYDPTIVVFHDLGSSSRQKWTSDSTRLARQAGHTAAMRESLGPVRFVFYDCLLLASLVLQACGGLVGHGPRPRLALRTISLCLSSFRPPRRGPAGEQTPAPAAPR